MPSLKDAHFRSWLEEIMGKEKAPFDDQRWNDILKMKVMAEMERRLDDNERKLEEAEIDRMHKLKTMGILHRNDWEEEERKRHARKPHKKTVAEKMFERRSKLLHQSVFQPSEDIESQMRILHRDESQVKGRTPRNNHSNNSSNSSYSSSNSNNDDSQNNDAAEDDNRDGERCNGGGADGQDKKETHRQLKKLFEEEDLRLLYKEAETLVRVHVTETGKKTAKK